LLAELRKSLFSMSKNLEIIQKREENEKYRNNKKELLLQL